ncbi:MAG: nucleoside triphosphate pyrophosphatase [Planctomycetia bacterium]|nr:nucleoside triphosphate pyrophosphatase [Planctomycetia bacterium]
MSARTERSPLSPALSLPPVLSPPSVPSPPRRSPRRCRLILASRSPRRAELLRMSGYDTEVVPASESAEPAPIPGETAISLVRRAAVAKATDVVGRLAPDGPTDEDLHTDVPRIVVGCDTVATLNGEILGKPADRADARRILRKLSGSEHECVSGLCVWNLTTDCERLECERTVLRMARLTDAQIESYLDSGLWEGKAGAYGLQDGVDWAEVVEGSESNVVGLPLELLEELLEVVAPIPADRTEPESPAGSPVGDAPVPGDRRDPSA